MEKVTNYLTNQLQIHSTNRKKVEDFARVLFFVQQEVTEAAASGGITPVRDYIASLIDLSNDTVLDVYLKKVIQDTKTAEKDPIFKNVMRDIYDGLKHDQSLKEKQIQPTNGDLVAAIERAQSPLFSGLVVAFSTIHPSVLPEVIASLETALPTGANWALAPVRESGKLVGKVGGKVATIGLAAVQLSYAAIKNLYAWWKGEITGKRCCKNIVDSVASIGGGIGGGYGGAIAGGAVAGPFGAIAGGVVGAVAGSQVAEKLTNKLTCKIFNIPKDAALEKAYSYLGVSQHADNSTINSAYRKLALKYHPDRGGKHEDFLELQIQMSVVKMARGELI